MLQRLVLFCRRSDHVRMAMTDADRDDASQAVEVALARVIPYILQLAFHQHEGFFVVEKNSGTKVLSAQSQDLFGRRALVWLRLVFRGRQSWMIHIQIKSKGQWLAAGPSWRGLLPRRTRSNTCRRDMRQKRWQSR